MTQQDPKKVKVKKLRSAPALKLMSTLGSVMEKKLGHQVDSFRWFFYQKVLHFMGLTRVDAVFCIFPLAHLSIQNLIKWKKWAYANLFRLKDFENRPKNTKVIAI